VWTTLGIVSGWALVFVALSFYLRKYIGVQRWRALHRFTALARILGVATPSAREPTPARCGS
jgi:sulfoxide reductase heme-binding subunit YedZ